MDAYESVCPPSCESLDAANLEKRLDELRVQFDERMDLEEDEFQRDQLQVSTLSLASHLRVAGVFCPMLTFVSLCPSFFCVSLVRMS